MCKGAAVPRLRGTRLDAGAGSHGDDSFGLAAASTWIPYVDPRSRPPALTYYPPPSITPLAPTSFSLPPSRPDQPPTFPSLSRPLCPPFHPPRRLLPAVSSYVFSFSTPFSLSLSLSYLFVDSFFSTSPWIQKFARFVSGPRSSSNFSIEARRSRDENIKRFDYDGSLGLIKETITSWYSILVLV